MTAARDQALAPLSRADAERLLPTLSVGRQSLERRILRARCLVSVESFDVARAELPPLHPQTKDPLLATRIAGDLIPLAHYPAPLDLVARPVTRPQRPPPA